MKNLSNDNYKYLFRVIRYLYDNNSGKFIKPGEGYYMTRAELTNLKWTDYDGSKMTFRKTKNKTDRVCPIFGEVKENEISQIDVPNKARKFLVFTYFTAGVSKLRYGGVEWLDGSTLSFYIQDKMLTLSFHLCL